MLLMSLWCVGCCAVYAVVVRRLGSACLRTGGCRASVAVLLVTGLLGSGAAPAGDDGDIGERDILVIRHAQSTGNLLRRFSTHPDNPHYFPAHLTSVGREQAMVLAARLQAAGYDADNIAVVLVSPLPRTQETAAILASELGISAERLVTDERLLERNLGLYDGMHYQALGEGDHWYPDNPGDFLGETTEQVRQRMLSAWQQAASWPAQGHVLIVSHGQPIHALSGLVCEQACRLKNADYVRIPMDDIMAAQPAAWPLSCEANSR